MQKTKLLLSKNTFKKIIFFILFSLLLFLTRFFRLDTAPKGIHIDEASFFINTISIVETGKDEDNLPYPLWFSSVIDSKPAIYSYIQLPFIRFFGISVLNFRLPAAILGTFSLLLFFVLLRKMTTSAIATTATILLAISPWHIMISRVTHEVILSFVFAGIAVLSYIKLIQTRQQLKQVFCWFLLFIVSCILGMYTYHSLKVFLPALFIGWSILEHSRFRFFSKQKTFIVRHFFLVTSVILVAIGITFFIPQSLERFNSIGFLHEQAPQLIAEEQVRRGTGASPLWMLRMFYNKVVTQSMAVFQTYTQHFSLDFWFFSGGHPKRYAVPFHGLFYLVELALLPIGIFIGLHQKKLRSASMYLIWWWLVAPITSALTSQEVPSNIRSFQMIVPMIFFISVAITTCWSARRHHMVKLFGLFILLGYIWGISYFFHQFFVQQPNYQPWNRNRSEEKLAQRILELESSYDIVSILNNDMYMYISLFDHAYLREVQKSFPVRKQPTFAIGKYIYSPRSNRCKPDIFPSNKRVLHVLSATCPTPYGYEVLDIIRYDDNAEVYQIIQEKIN